MGKSGNISRNIKVRNRVLQVEWIDVGVLVSIKKKGFLTSSIVPGPLSLFGHSLAATFGMLLQAFLAAAVVTVEKFDILEASTLQETYIHMLEAFKQNRNRLLIRPCHANNGYSWPRYKPAGRSAGAFHSVPHVICSCKHRIFYTSANKTSYRRLSDTRM